MHVALAIAIVAQLGIGAVLVGLTATTRVPSPLPIPDLSGYGRIWQAQHGASDFDPLAGRVMRRYLALMWRAAAPLARAGVAPAAVTGWGVWLALWAPIAVSMTRDRAARVGVLVAALLIVGSAVVDGIDGAVAGLANRASAQGFVLDSMADRISDLAFAGALVAAGWPVDNHRTPAALWAGVAAVVGLLLLEYLRARIGIALQTEGAPGEVGVITVGERPSRVITTAFGLMGMAVMPDRHEVIAGLSLAAIAVLAVVGLAQLAHDATRRSIS